MWICKRCGVPSKRVVTAKIAEIGGSFVGDICLRCLREEAEMDISMEKMDNIGIGYTKEVLEEGSMPLPICTLCMKNRVLTINGKPVSLCSGCFLYYRYRDNNVT